MNQELKRQFNHSMYELFGRIVRECSGYNPAICFHIFEPTRLSSYLSVSTPMTHEILPVPPHKLGRAPFSANILRRDQR
jgi:hypothetical protein